MKSRWWTVYNALTSKGAGLVFGGLLTVVAWGFCGDALIVDIDERPVRIFLGIAIGCLMTCVVIFVVFACWILKDIIEGMEPSEPPERIKNAIKRRQTKDHDKRGGVSFVANEGGEITEVEQ